MRRWRGAGLLLVAALVTACDVGGTTSTAGSTPTTSAAPRTSLVPWYELPGATTTPTPTLPDLGPEDVDVADPQLRDELLLMQAQDQMERTGAGLPPGVRLPPIRDYDRAERLKEIIAASGWPTDDLVGPLAASAAWLVAQHADHDVPFQQAALALLVAAADEGQASRGDVAYLTDRVAVNTGRPQTYGTQIRCRDGEPQPATPLVDPAAVERLRAEAGLGTLTAYLDSMRMACANEGTEGLETG